MRLTSDLFLKFQIYFLEKSCYLIKFALKKKISFLLLCGVSWKDRIIFLPPAFILPGLLSHKVEKLGEITFYRFSLQIFWFSKTSSS